MSDTGLTVPGMTERSRCYEVTITVDRDVGHLLNPAEFTTAARQQCAVALLRLCQVLCWCSGIIHGAGFYGLDDLGGHYGGIDRQVRPYVGHRADGHLRETA